MSSDQLLSFYLGEQVFALNLYDVREIIESHELTVIPEVPDYYLGTLRIRGRNVPVLDLAKRLGMDRQASERPCIILSEFNFRNETMLVGLHIDGVKQVIDMEGRGIEETPDIGGGGIEIVQGTVNLGDHSVVVLRLEYIFDLEKAA